MELDINIMPSGDLLRDIEAVIRVEQLGFDGFWFTEGGQNPFFPLTLAAKETSRIRLGTQGALAFPRSPMVTAQIAWDLASQSEGRFVLGLGTQAQTYLEGDLNEEAKYSTGRAREYIESLRAIWNTFQTDARLRYRGEHYQFRLMAPFFNPGPISHPAIAIYLDGANPDLCRLAGEICQGLHAPALHNAAYLRDVILPAVDEGLGAADRTKSEFTLVAPIFVISGATEVEWERAASAARKRIAWRACSPAHRSFMRRYGWESLAQELSAMARDHRWEAMTHAISDDVLAEFAIIAEPDELCSRITQRYGGLADRVYLLGASESLDYFGAIVSGRNSD